MRSFSKVTTWTGITLIITLIATLTSALPYLSSRDLTSTSGLIRSAYTRALVSSVEVRLSKRNEISGVGPNGDYQGEELLMRYVELVDCAREKVKRLV